MKLIKTHDYKYPNNAVLEDGTEILLARQSRFTDPWLKAHGCSLVAEFEALQWLGVKKKWWPIYLEEWHRNNTPEDVLKKVTLLGVTKGINVKGKGKGEATYYKTVTEKRVREALDSGAFVIYERKSPIHSLCLIKDAGQVYKLNAGTARKSSAAYAARTATTSKRYGGMIIVRRVKK